MPLSDTYKAWRDSTPVTPFPFTFKDRKEGRIVQTWKDVHEKLGRDAVNLAMPFCTAHIVPSTIQSNCITDLIKSEHRTLRRHAQRPTSAALANTSTTVNEESLHLSSSATISQPPTSRARELLYTARERDALLSGEGGGRARRAFLKLRAHRPLLARFSNPKTSSQAYGWGFEDEAGNFQRPLQPKYATADFRKKSCIKAMSRPNGVFERPEFF